MEHDKAGKLYIITAEDFTLRDEIKNCFHIFQDLEAAEKWLQNISTSFVNYKYAPYQIKVYKFNGTKFEITGEVYNYS